MGTIDQDGQGLLSSTYLKTRMFACGMEVIIGDLKDEANPFHWDSVAHNCPGTNEYDLSMPRLYLWDSKHQVITAACNNFVDDSRSVAANKI